MLDSDQTRAGGVGSDLERVIGAGGAANKITGSPKVGIGDRAHQDLKILLTQMPVSRDRRTRRRP